MNQTNENKDIYDVAIEQDKEKQGQNINEVKNILSLRYDHPFLLNKISYYFNVKTCKY
jgi:hypothetical protein